MKGTIKRLMVVAGVVMGSLAGFTETAIAANAQTKANLNIPWKNIHYFYPKCVKHMNIFEPRYGGMICSGYYAVNHSNYIFTQDDTGVCPAMGEREYITLRYVISPDADGIEGDTLVGFSVTSR